MINASPNYADAITASRRQVIPRAIMDLIDPDIVFGAATSNGELPCSKTEQLINKEFEQEGIHYLTLEHNRWSLDGTWTPFPAPSQAKGEIGYIGSHLGAVNCIYTTRPYVQLNMTHLRILQAVSVHFPRIDADGHGVDFTVQVFSGARVGYEKIINGNRERSVFLTGFTVENVTAVRVTFAKWSVPYRYARAVEIVPGIYEVWQGETISNIDVLHETAFDCLTVPYGTCILTVHNRDKRFNPYNRSGLFRSIEARQGLPIAYGVKMGSTIEYLPLGVFYQQNGGWETDAYGLNITFKLVDIIGLVSKREFKATSSAPTTLAGWIAAIVGHLGNSFSRRYFVAPSIAQTPVTGIVEGLTCGQVLRYACMAACAWARADAQTGDLRVEPVGNTRGATMDFANMYQYPKNSANNSVAQLTFRLADEAKTQYTVPGTQQACDLSISITNPFISTTGHADRVAAHILRFYGGIKFVVYGRGDMRSELGDIDTVETGFGSAETGRRYKQQLKFAGGVLKTAPSYLLKSGDLEG